MYMKNTYLNIPFTEMISINLSEIFHDTINTFIRLSRDFFKLIEHNVKNSFFIFSDKLYGRVDGLGMELPLSSTFANVIQCFHERKWKEHG